MYNFTLSPALQTLLIQTLLCWSPLKVTSNSIRVYDLISLSTAEIFSGPQFAPLLSSLIGMLGCMFTLRAVGS